MVRAQQADVSPAAGEADSAGFDDVLAELRERRLEFREQRYVPKDFVARLKQVGIYRAATPTRFGGDQLPPAEFLDRIERLSAVDGSTG